MSGGGVVIYVIQHIPHFQRSEISNTSLEIVGIEIEPKHAKHLTIIYMPPTSNNDDSFFNALHELISKLNFEGKEIFLMGDIS